MSKETEAEEQQRVMFGARVHTMRIHRKMSQEQLAKEVGMSQQGIVSIEKGEVARPRKLRELALALDVREGWLLDGKGPRHRPDIYDQAEDSPEGDTFDVPKRPLSGIVEIDVRAGLGGGGTVDQTLAWHDGKHVDPVKSESWRFPTQFMRNEIRAPEDRVIIIETEGDSMAPTILSGDRVIVDTGHRLPSPDGIYAVRDRYGSIVVKRLQVLRKGNPPVIRVISDNKSHDPEDVGADEIYIVGRVLWGLKRL